MQVLAIGFSIIQLISAISIIVLVISQTTKSEGLSGTIGGKATSTFRGKPGIDDKLSSFTRYAAIAFLTSSLMVYYFTSRMA